MNESSRNESAESRGIAVIATRIPYIDRRSLSEAWFSALHLASDGPASPKPADRRAAALSRDASHAALAARGETERAPARVIANAAASSRAPRIAVDSRVASTQAARRSRAATAFASARSYAPFRTSLTLGVDGERVALLLRREGATLHVVALCRPAIADLVRRALGCADLSLRSRGESVCSRVEVLPHGVTA